MVEQGTENPRVVGSIPTGGTISADLAHLVERHLAKVEVAGSSPVIRSKRRTLEKSVLFLHFGADRGIHPPRSLWLLGFERSKHSCTAREYKPHSHYSLFFRIRYVKNNIQLFLSAHVIRSKNKKQTLVVCFLFLD